MALLTCKTLKTFKRYHRRFIAENTKDAKEEYSFIEKALEEDNKNYHAWSHRQWVNTFFNSWENELEYTQNMIKIDPRNNSAFNHRHFVVEMTTEFTEEVIKREIKYIFSFSSFLIK